MAAVVQSPGDAPMGINSSGTKTQGGGMGVPLRQLLDEAPADAPDVDFEDLEPDDGDHEYRSGVRSSGHDVDRDGDGNGEHNDDLEGGSEDEAPPRKAREEDSKSRLISKLKARDRELSDLRRSERTLRREVESLKAQEPKGTASIIDRRDPGGSIVRLLKEALGSKLDDKAFNALAREHLTDALIDVQPEIAERDPKLKGRREQRLTQAALDAEREEFRRMADESRSERERMQSEVREAAETERGRSEIKRFWEIEGAAYPYLSVVPSALADLTDVLEEMALSGDHDFRAGPGQAKRIAEGFRIGAKRLNEYHRQQAVIYGKVNVRSKPAAEADADSRTTGKNGSSPGKKDAAVRGQRQRQRAQPNDEPDPNLRFTDFVDQQERAKRRGMGPRR